MYQSIREGQQFRTELFEELMIDYLLNIKPNKRIFIQTAIDQIKNTLIKVLNPLNIFTMIVYINIL